MENERRHTPVDRRQRPRLDRRGQPRPDRRLSFDTLYAQASEEQRQQMLARAQQNPPRESL